MVHRLLAAGLTLAFVPGAWSQAALPSQATQTNTPAPLMLTLDQALERARQYSPQLVSADVAAQLAREDRRQAKAALLPNANWFNQFIYTQPNGAPSGVFIANDGPHVYNNWAVVHGDIYAPGRLADYHRSIAAEAVAQARALIALRGLNATVVQSYYGMAVAERRIATAQETLNSAQQFLDITQKQERGGEVAHADVVKAQIQVEQQRVGLQNAQVDLEKARAGLGVLVFPTFGQPFSIVDDLDQIAPLPALSEVQALAARNNPDIRAAQATVAQQNWEIKSARAALYPSLSFDYFYGIDANDYALYNREHQRNLGSVAQAQMNIPVWTWGANRSKIRQAELRLHEAQVQLTFQQRQLLANLNSFYQEAQTAANEVGTLRHTVDLAGESLRLTVLRYEAGEATALEVVDAQTTLAQARNASDDGLVRYRLALANLQTLTGVF